MRSGSEEGSNVRLIRLLDHSILGLRVIRKKRSSGYEDDGETWLQLQWFQLAYLTESVHTVVLQRSILAQIRQPLFTLVIMNDGSTVRLGCRGTSLIRNRTLLGPYRRPMPRVLGGSQRGGRFLMGEIAQYAHAC